MKPQFVCAAALCAAMSLASLAAAQPAPPPPLLNDLLPHLPEQRLRVDRLTLGDVSIPPHRHSGSVYLYVLEGTALMEVDGQETVLRPGDSFLEPAGALHAVAKSAGPGTPAVLLAVSIGPDGAPAATFE